MGILNVTPDSFSDGGKFYQNGILNVDALAEAARRMIVEGAAILDIGGESSGPDSKDVSLEEELRRVIPSVEGVVKVMKEFSKIVRDELRISVDTYKAEVARQAIAAGATMINDVTALRGDPKMASAIAKTGVPIILMYSKDPTARTTRDVIQYEDVMKTISNFFEERISYAVSNGIQREQILLDPGLGFFVSGEAKYSFEILERIDELKRFDLPLVLGPSRKSFLGGRIQDRLPGTIDFCRKAALKGVSILRIHDVRAVAEACGSVIAASSARSDRPAS